ncbi:C6 transcription factor [Seiridium cupressi]
MPSVELNVKRGTNSDFHARSSMEPQAIVTPSPKRSPVQKPGIVKLAQKVRSKSVQYPITIHIKVPELASGSANLGDWLLRRNQSAEPPIPTSSLLSHREMPASETSPLLWSTAVSREPYRSRSQDRLPYWRQDESVNPVKHKDQSGNNPHAQFCTLIGCPPSGLAKDQKFTVNKKSLYGRTISLLASQRLAYHFSASLSNTMLLSQVVLGAALTALGASESSHILITVFGAMNTVIAGLIAYLKSRGQPMRARMFRDDLERLLDEIENSEVMWRGISEGAHGYEEIDTDEVTVRSEVARLTRLYERAVRLNGMNNPDMYMAGAGGFDGNANGGARPNRGGPYPRMTLPAVAAQPAPQPSADNSGPAVPVVAAPEDTAPATKVIAKEEKKEEKKDETKAEEKQPLADGIVEDKGKAVTQPESASEATLSPAPTPAPAPTSTPAQPTVAQAPAPVLNPDIDPDASPATAARLKPKKSTSVTEVNGIGGNSQKSP